ncbi:MAG: molybdopterin-dependent oxidoreductase [Gracilibacteraceae bacterium]|nr:molybdopterin-dependent oxidoreductase [Gracilibacteraceae bacterium]
MEKKKKRSGAAAAGIALLLLLLLLPALSACGVSGSRAEEMVAAYAEEAIVVSGLLEEEFIVTPGELAALEWTSVPTSAVRADGRQESRKATGPLLNTFLAQYGYQQTDFSRVRFVAADGYTVTLAKSLAERDIILTLGYGSDPLPESEAPLRVITPGLEANQWIYMVNRMEFIK